MRRYRLNGEVSCVSVSESSLSLLKALELIEQRTQKNPWNAQSLKECFSDTYKVIVLYAGKISEGFAVIYNTKVTTDLLTIGIDPEYQGRGLGRFLLRCALAEALHGGADECFLEVRVSNTRAQNLYRSLGFEQVGLRHGYYGADSSGPAEDAYTMRLADIRAALGNGCPRPEA